MSSTLLLPDLYKEWPFRATLNPYHDSASVASVEWVENLRPFDDKAQAIFNRCNFPLAASLAYPYADPTHLRLACDLMNWFFVFDELSDVQDGPAARELSMNLVDILQNPSKVPPHGESVLEEMTRSFWSRVLAYSSPSSSQRLLESLRPYIEAVWQEAEDREHGRIRSLEEYLVLRRNSAGTRPCFDFILLPMDIPLEVTMHPRIECLTRTAIDVFILINDVYSYAYERSRGLDGHNVVTAVMKEKNMNVQEAMDYVGGMFCGLTRKFVQDSQCVPSFSASIDKEVAAYISGLATCVAALIDWSFQSERYFGTNGSVVKRTRKVDLYSRSKVDEAKL